MYLEKARLDGKVALIVGAGAGGIGTYTSLALAEAGAQVIAVDKSLELLADTERQIEQIGGYCYGILADVLQPNELRNAIRRSIEEAGPIHCLVNVAGGMLRGQWHRTDLYPDNTYDEVLGLNLRYVFTACREIGRHMIEEGVEGRIVNFASVSGIAGAPYHGPYGAAKAAVMSLTRSMAVEWGEFGIRVNAIAPGTVATPRNLYKAGSEEHARSWNPIPRRLEPEELAAVTLFLLSDLSSGITGQVLTVDLGASARFPLGGIERYANLEE